MTPSNEPSRARPTGIAPEAGRTPGWRRLCGTTGSLLAATALALALTMVDIGAPGASAVDGSAKGGGASGEDARAARLTLNLDGTELHVEGDFTDGVARRLRRLLRANLDVRLISLTSDGGLVDEAEQIGDIVASLGLSTHVPTVCASACTLAFVRGQERLVAPGARLGFHAPWEEDENGLEVAVDSADETQSYVAAGIAPDFVAQALKVPPADIWVPDLPALLAAGVVTAVVPPDGLGERIRTLPPRRTTFASARP